MPLPACMHVNVGRQAQMDRRVGNIIPQVADRMGGRDRETVLTKACSTSSADGFMTLTPRPAREI